MNLYPHTLTSTLKFDKILRYTKKEREITVKKIISTILLAAMLMLCFISCEEERLAPGMNDLNLSSASSIEGVKISEEETNYVLIDVENYGQILIRLFPNVAPDTVKNFKKLVGEKFYDGIIFHRVIQGFMIQGGDPDGTGMGGSKDEIKGEFSSNGFENNLLHLRGVVSMARANDPDSASSQFFIVHKTYPSLDGNYAAFGYVVYGMDVVDSIVKVSVDRNDKPGIDVVMKSVRFADVSGVNFDIEF
jgi:peptidyl-prolyl cis-trans isomerase B (cyclophilin B)